MEEISDNIFGARNITVVKQGPKRKFVPPFVAGSLHKKTNQDILSDISIKAASKAVREKKIPKTVQKNKSSTKKSTTVVNKCPSSAKKCSKVSSGKAQKTIQPVQSTSGLNKRKGAPIDLISEDSCDGDSAIFNDDDELCCVCVRWEPKELQQCNAFVIAKWAKCDYCPHWTHLIYCSEVRFVRFREEFRCPHCLTKP